MSNSISTLLLRNLSDVFGENDPARRRAAIDEIFHEDAVFYDPKGGIFRGRDEINRIAGVLKATHPDFEYQLLFPPEELGDAGRVRWVSGTPGKTTSLRGNRFYRRPERPHCFALSLFRRSSLKQKCATSMRSNALLRQLS
ncbi:MAG TPA: nuclear transport factor 2 family protein [Candidatus Acidoferrum sp.]|nr:nuclear transport factor 2 family protein [Candidatus Acidoferrum sp.]